jgi:serine/threonine protein kinase
VNIRGTLVSAAPWWHGNHSEINLNMHKSSTSVREIVAFARGINADAARQAFLAQACAGNPGLREQVEALLQDGDDGGASTEDTVRRVGVSACALLPPPTRPGSLGRLAHYEILGVLGQGGFGTVFKAFDDRLHRFVALKMLAPALAASEPARQRFLREARVTAAVRHDHVVAIYAVEEVPVPYLVMEYVAGVTLQHKLDETGPLPVQDILHLGQQIALGLAAAHQRGLIHRDIKPANILLETDSNRVKITDFGLARAVDDGSLSQSGTVAGTPLYMAPEQVMGASLDQRTDLFSLGSTLYALATGRPAFRAPGSMAILYRVVEEVPPPPHEINTAIPLWLSACILRLLAKLPQDRYQSAREVADWLGQHLAQLPAHDVVVAVPATTASPRPADTLNLRRLAPAPRRTDRPAVESAAPVTEEYRVAAPHRRRSGPGRWLALILGALFLGGGAFALYELIFNTAQGRIIVQIDGDDIEARFKNGKIELYDADGQRKYTLAPTEHTRDLPSGKYNVKVPGVPALRLKVTGADGLERETEQFEMKRGGKVIVRVVLEPIKTVPPKAPEAAGPLPRTFTNSLGMKFVLVPRGKAWLGGGAGKVGSEEIEFKQDIYLGAYEVTQQEWESIMGKNRNPSRFSRTGK